MKKGFSVVEAIVVISILVIILFYSFSFFNFGTDEKCVAEFKVSDEFRVAVRDCMVYTEKGKWECEAKVLRAECGKWF